MTAPASTIPTNQTNDHSRKEPSLHWRIIDLIKWGTDYFSDRNIANARLEVEWLLAHQLELKRVDLYVQHGRLLTPGELKGFKELVRRRVAGEPFQYILGKAPFYGRDFTVNPAVLIPRPETEVLIQVLRRGSTPGAILDIGTGSGCLAITAALLYPDSRIIAVDNSPAALEIARTNARRFQVTNISFQNRDLLKVLPEGKFDVILCNPPYVAADDVPTLQREIREHEPLAALTDGADGLTWFRRLAEIGPRLLLPDGRLITEIGGSSQAEPVRLILRNAGADVALHKDLQEESRICEGRWVK